MNIYKIKIDDLIAICNIFNEMGVLKEELINLAKNNDIITTVTSLKEVRRGLKFFGTKDLLNFAQKHEISFQKISNKTDLDEFLIEMGKGDFNYLYEYMCANIGNIDKIENLCNRLKSLGFKSLGFNDEFDFSTMEFEIKNKKELNQSNIAYLENMKPIVSIDTDILKYKSTVSNYMIVFNPIVNHFEIFLNDLTIDVDRLPKTMNASDLFKEIFELNKLISFDQSLVKDSVNLSVGILDLNEIVNNVSNRLSKLENVNESGEIKKILHDINSRITQLKLIKDGFNESIVTKSEYISDELLETEKHNYIRKREINNTRSIHNK